MSSNEYKDIMNPIQLTLHRPLLSLLNKMPAPETVLILGATGNIGVSAVIATLRTGRHVLAIVRNQESAEKMFRHAGTREGITTVEADVVSEEGVKGVVEKVRRGEVRGFEHVYTAGE